MTTKTAQHEMVDKFVKEYCGELNIAPYLHIQIDNQHDRDWLYWEFREWYDELTN